MIVLKKKYNELLKNYDNLKEKIVRQEELKDKKVYNWGIQLENQMFFVDATHIRTGIFTNNISVLNGIEEVGYFKNVLFYVRTDMLDFIEEENNDR